MDSNQVTMLPVQAMLTLIVARPGLDSAEIRRLLDLPTLDVSMRTRNYIKNGMIRVEKQMVRNQPVNRYFPTQALIESLPHMVFVSRPHRKDWSDQDIALLIRDYATRDTVELAKEFDVTVGAVRFMARKFGVSKTQEYWSSVSRKGSAAAKVRCQWKIWSDQDIALLMRDYPDRDTVELANELGATPRSVRRMARRLGVTKTHEYMLLVCRKAAAAANALPPELREVMQLTARLRRRLNEQS